MMRVLLTLALTVSLTSGAETGSKTELLAFVNSQNLPKSLQDGLAEKLTDSPSADVWLVEAGQWLGALARVARHHVDESPALEARLQTARSRQAQALAVQGLFLQKFASKVDRERYAEPDTLSRALAALYESWHLEGRIGPGLQSTQGALDGDGVALLWVAVSAVEEARVLIADWSAVTNRYCALLQQEAESHLASERFQEALVQYEEVTKLGQANLATHIGLAEAALAVHLPKKARAALHNAWNTTPKLLSSRDAERIGEAALELGEDEIAESAFDYALQAYFEETGRQASTLGRARGREG